MTSKQTELVKQLKAEGVIFEVVNKDGHDWINIIQRPHYNRYDYGYFDEDDYDIGVYELCVDGYGD